MGNDTLTRATIFIILGVIVFSIVMLVLVGPNGLIEHEKQEYNDTHVEEVQNKNNQIVVRR